MSTALSIAASGMAAASLRLEVSAGNVANALTTGPLPTAAGSNAASYPKAYLPQRVRSGRARRRRNGGHGPAGFPEQRAPIRPQRPQRRSQRFGGRPQCRSCQRGGAANSGSRYSFAANAAVARAVERLNKTLLDTTS
ncbi:MAG TPA: flagellar basal body protein [Xanthobacteraceae bacterium]